MRPELRDRGSATHVRCTTCARRRASALSAPLPSAAERESLASTRGAEVVPRASSPPTSSRHGVSVRAGALPVLRRLRARRERAAARTSPRDRERTTRALTPPRAAPTPPRSSRVRRRSGRHRARLSEAAGGRGCTARTPAERSPDGASVGKPAAVSSNSISRICAGSVLVVDRGDDELDARLDAGVAEHAAAELVLEHQGHGVLHRADQASRILTNASILSTGKHAVEQRVLPIVSSSSTSPSAAARTVRLPSSRCVSWKNTRERWRTLAVDRVTTTESRRFASSFKDLHADALRVHLRVSIISLAVEVGLEHDVQLEVVDHHRFHVVDVRVEPDVSWCERCSGPAATTHRGVRVPSMRSEPWAHDGLSMETMSLQDRRRTELVDGGEPTSMRRDRRERAEIADDPRVRPSNMSMQQSLPAFGDANLTRFMTAATASTTPRSADASSNTMVHSGGARRARLLASDIPWGEKYLHTHTPRKAARRWCTLILFTE